ncbi:MAG TPA: TonB-dependent receptor [Sphingobium sp.]|uniref:TonB-dependent receptor n=1 Tax=Sphingobium sp. TaxID=1912891 RepID=UPI002ED1CC12
MIAKHASVRVLAICSCAIGALAATTVSAQSAPATPDSGASNGIAEIVVTAQKREQNQQDVPISLTAVTADALEANRITSVNDLGTAVPNLATRATAGGAQSPAFTMRGITSYGVVPGSDKELSIYIDGVYIASTVGSALDLPEVSQIEVLRGPQGTLFGRNATVGAISVITRDPPEKFGLDQEFTYGNYRQFRSKTRIDTGSFGPFSATVSFVHDQRRGDIRNLGAGTTYTNPSSSGLPATLVSPEYLGDKNLDAVFGAIKFEPSGSFKMVNKFDWTGNHYTPQGSSVVGFFTPGLGAAGGGFLDAVLATQATPLLINATGKRPKETNNSFNTPSYARDWGDSLTATLALIDNLSLKNVAAYRSSYVRATNQLDGAGGLKITSALAAIPGFGAFAPLVGSPFIIFGIQQLTKSEQYSDELQANYNSRLLTLTAGAMYFHVKGESGGAPGEPNDVILSAVPFGNLGLAGAPSRAFYAGKSLAAYAQAELHASAKIDIVGGLRVTNDKKTGSFVTTTTLINTPYDATRASYSAGINYKPNSDILLYAKYSNAFVAGGFAGPVNYKPEIAKSWEAGIKSDWFDHRLRANLALFDVKYTDIQTAQSGSTLLHPEISLVVADLGDERAKGFELETTAVPIQGVTLGAAMGYTDVKFTRVNPILTELGVASTLDNFKPTLQPKWTTNLSAEYDTPELFGDARMTVRVDASWRSKERIIGYAVLRALPQYNSIDDAPATWIVNGRIALEHIKLPVGEGEIAAWVKNLTNDRSITFPDDFGFIGATEWQAARTFGVDVAFKY